MASGTLYTYPESFRAFKVLIADQYSGNNVKVAPNFVLGETNTTPEFLEKFPLGKVPAFETGDGKTIVETNAIAYYVSSSQLRGGECSYGQAQVQQYVNMADNEVLPSVCTWVYPTLGIMQYNATNTKEAQEQLKKVLGVLNGVLAAKTFLVGERVTLADISMVCNLLLAFKQVFDEAFRQLFPNVKRWFLTCVNQPQFRAVLGEVQLCSKTAQFDSKKYNDLFGKKKEKTPKKVEAKKPEPKKKEAKEEPEEEDDDTPKPEKSVDPYADVPKSSFVMDAFKRCYSNEDTVTKAIPHFWENFNKEDYSIWKAVYLYPEDIKMNFMGSNLVSGMFQRLEKLKKTAFASVLVLSSEGRFNIEGVWVFRGQELAFNLAEDWNIDAPSYQFSKLNPDSDADKAEVNKFFLWEGDFGNRKVEDGKVFK